jgi:HAD superfamily hydrolase (TIGR01458 family)
VQIGPCVSKWYKTCGRNVQGITMKEDTLSVEGLLLDMDGVFYVGGTLLPGARETIDQLRSAKLPFRFITNTTTRTTEDLLQKLKGFGLDTNPEELYTAVSATIQFLESQGNPSLYLLVRDAIRPVFSEFPEDRENPDYVIIGDIGAQWDYKTLNQVFRMLMHGSKLVCMHRNKFFEKEDGLHMDIGAFVAALEYVADCEALVLGKPAPGFFKQAVDSLDCSPHKVAIVGDDIDSDIGGGQDFGLQGILVQTGKYRESYCQKSSVNPNHTIPSIAELPELLGWRI